VVCTIQTFPFAIEEVRELAAAQGKRFAVIAYEAHSSQAGDAAARLKAVLSPEELADLEDAARSARKTFWRRKCRRVPVSQGLPTSPSLPRPR
jgi:hypothetical protein